MVATSCSSRLVDGGETFDYHKGFLSGKTFDMETVAKHCSDAEAYLSGGDGNPPGGAAAGWGSETLNTPRPF